MINVYDLLLNFNLNLYEFYEWEEFDKISNIKKIPLYRVDSDLLYSFCFSDINVSKDFLNFIYNKTLGFYEKYDYMCLLTDCNRVVGFKFDNNGNIIARSSLLIDEEDECLKFSKDLDITKINFKFINKNKYKLNNNTRRYNYLHYKNNLYLNNIYNSKDYDQINYLYLELFNDYSKSNILYKYDKLKECNPFKLNNLLNKKKKLNNLFS